MSFPKYEKYKESGVEWVGKVPQHWETKRLKYVASLLTDKSNQRNNAVALENIEGWSGRFVPSETEFAGDGVDFETGDILFGKLRPYLAKVWLAEFSGEAVGDFYVMRPSNKNCGRYMAYLMLTRDFISIVDGSTFGAKMPRASWDFMCNMILPVPPREEQTAIANFLDAETAKIDALVAEQRRLIELLKEKRQAVISHAVTKGLNPNAPMKDSGIEWLGDVPEHWEVIRMGVLYADVAENGNDDLPVLQVSIHHGVSDRELSESESDRKITRIEDKSKYKRVVPNDLVYNMMRAWQGGFGTVKVEGMVSPAYVVARPKLDFQTQFVEHLFRTPQAIEQMRRYSHGVTDFRLRLYWDKFKNVRVALPDKSEQEEICKYIEETTTEFEKLAAEAEQAIELLQERRTALISAAVTGKIDVREYAAQETA